MSYLICNELLHHHIITCGLISYVSHINTISPSKLSLNYQNETRIFHSGGLFARAQPGSGEEQGTKQRKAASREPGSPICGQPNTPLAVFAASRRILANPSRRGVLSMGVFGLIPILAWLAQPNLASTSLPLARQDLFVWLCVLLSPARISLCLVG